MNEMKTLHLKGANGYLINSEKGWILVDTGDRKGFKILKTALNKYKLTPQDIRYVLITHHHSDHAGNLREFLSASEADVIAHIGEKQFLFDGVTEIGGYYNRKVMIIGKIINLMNNHLYPNIRDMGSRIHWVKEERSDMLKKLGVCAELIHTPGHTPGSISIIFENGDCICGDAAMNMLTTPFPLVAFDYDQVRKSWKILMENGAKTFYSGHGEPLNADVISQYI